MSVILSSCLWSAVQKSLNIKKLTSLDTGQAHIRRWQPPGMARTRPGRGGGTGDEHKRAALTGDNGRCGRPRAGRWCGWVRHVALWQGAGPEGRAGLMREGGLAKLGGRGGCRRGDRSSLRAWRSLGSRDGGLRFWGWLGRVVRHLLSRCEFDHHKLLQSSVAASARTCGERHFYSSWRASQQSPRRRQELGGCC